MDQVNYPRLFADLLSIAQILAMCVWRRREKGGSDDIISVIGYVIVAALGSTVATVSEKKKYEQ